MKVFIAIDPGVSGGIAVAMFGATVCHAMPATQGDVLELIRDLKRAADVECALCECVLEEVGGFAGKAQPGSAMFKFGEGYGFLKGVVQALGIKLVLVRPQVWQKSFNLGTASRCASKSEWKNKLKAEAQRRFPQLPVTLATADALLILEWSLRTATSAARATGQTRTATREKQRAEIGKAEIRIATPLPDRGGEGASRTGNHGAHGGPSRTGNDGAHGGPSRTGEERPT